MGLFKDCCIESVILEVKIMFDRSVVRHKGFFFKPDNFVQIKGQRQKHQSPGTVYIAQSKEVLFSLKF